MRRPVAVMLIALALLASPAAEARRRPSRTPGTTPRAHSMEGGYASAASVTQGATIDFHIATRISPFTLSIVNLKAPQTVLKTLTLLSARQPCTGRYERGCDWPVTSVFAVPADWPSGYYAARFPTSVGTRHIFFLIREDQPGSQSRMVVVVSTHTYQAYNSYGDKSVYPSGSPARSYRVSFDRPYHDDRGLGRFHEWDAPFLAWMTSEGRAFEVLADDDLEDPAILANYDLVALVGHSEYWTGNGRASLEQFVGNGGRVAIFGGDTMWWQARIEDRKLVVYKSAAADPETGRTDSIVTVNWFDEPVLRPENLIVGASYRNARLTNEEGPVHSYRVAEPSHWVFEGTGVSNGTQFGALAAGDEVDGALYNCTMNGLEVDGSDGTPLNFRILATVPASEGHGTIGIYTHPSGGAVFNAGSQDWASGLATDPVVAAMTRNVLDRFLQARLTHVPVASPIRMRELFNCALDTTGDKFVPGWRGEYGSLALSSRCAAEGPSGLELTGTPRVQMRRGFAPTGNVMSHAALTFSLNADGSSGPGMQGAPVVTLQSRKGTAVPRVARVEIQPATKSVRLVLFNANNAATVLGPWMPLAAGWNTLHLEWRSPGPSSLRIGGGGAQTLANPLSGQVAGDVLITYDQPSASGYLCLDALSVETP